MSVTRSIRKNSDSWLDCKVSHGNTQHIAEIYNTRYKHGQKFPVARIWRQSLYDWCHLTCFFFSIIRDLGQNVLLCTKLALTSSDLKDSKLYRSWPVEWHSYRAATIPTSLVPWFSDIPQTQNNLHVKLLSSRYS